MRRKITDLDINNAIKLIKSGSTVSEASAEVGFHPDNISFKIRQTGFVIPKRTRPLQFNLSIEDINAMYQGGESENAIAKHYGVSRGVIRKRLLKAGIKPRSQSESEKLKWSKMNEHARHNQVKNAHKSNQGRIVPEKERILRASTREKACNQYFVGPGEAEFCELLSDRGIYFVPQKAINIYNVDIAIGNVAVEITTDVGRYTMFNPREIKRAKNLLNFGYHVLAVEFPDISTLIGCSDYIIKTIDEFSRLKPTVSEYWVVRCCSDIGSIRKDKRHNITRISPSKNFFTKRSVIQL